MQAVPALYKAVEAQGRSAPDTQGLDKIIAWSVWGITTQNEPWTWALSSAVAPMMLDQSAELQPVLSILFLSVLLLLFLHLKQALYLLDWVWTLWRGIRGRNLLLTPDTRDFHYSTAHMRYNKDSGSHSSRIRRSKIFRHKWILPAVT